MYKLINFFFLAEGSSENPTTVILVEGKTIVLLLDAIWMMTSSYNMPYMSAFGFCLCGGFLIIPILWLLPYDIQYYYPKTLHIDIHI